MGGNVATTYLIGIFKVVLTRNKKKLRIYIDDELIIQDQMASLGTFMDCTFDNFLVSPLVVAHTLNNTEIDVVNEGQKGDDGSAG